VERQKIGRFAIAAESETLPHLEITDPIELANSIS